MSAVPAGLAAGLVAALGSMSELHKDKTANVSMKTGGTYSYSYTDLASVLGYVRPILAEHGIVVMQPATCDGSMASVMTTFLHRSGERIDLPPLGMPCGRTPQEVGSAITYARRYSLLSALGLATEDDDGEAASKAAAPAQARKKTAPKTAPKAAPAGGVDKVTRHVMAMFAELGLGGDANRAARLARTSSIVGYDVASWKDVRPDDQEQVVAALELERSHRLPLDNDYPPHPGDAA